MPARDGQTREAVAAALDRHDQRRQANVPTISVLVGPVVASQRLFLPWAESRSGPVVNIRLEQPNPRAVVVRWVDELVKNCDLADAAIQWLAQRLNRNAQVLERSLRLMTLHELEKFLESCLSLGSGTVVEIVGRRLIECMATGTGPRAPDFADSLDWSLEGHGRPWIRLYGALGELVDRDCLPVVVVSLTEPNLTGLEAIARLLANLATTQPRTGLALMVDPALFDSFIALAPASRAKALLLESIVTLSRERLSVTVGPVLSSHPATESTSTRDDLMAQSPESGIGDLDALQLFSDDDDEARSAAERFLFERLESAADTTGLFELNATLNFHFGSSRWIEVDLTARSLKLAIEVDGYHHFHDPEAFRRDRRKDLELQKHGNLVMRVLAEDVVERLEEVMDTVVTAVAFRRAAVLHLGATP